MLYSKRTESISLIMSARRRRYNKRNYDRSDSDSDVSESETNVESTPNVVSTAMANRINPSETASINERKIGLIQEYSKDRGNTTMNETTMKSLTRAVRLVIIPKLKFIAGGKGFGSFEQPDFTQPNCWVNKLFDRIANLKSASDKKKAEIWMTYRKKIKEQFSLHRSAKTLKIKNAFLKGKCIQIAFLKGKCKCLSSKI